jgi:hypothetical protein
MVPHHLREGMLSADFYDPGLNPLHREVLALYGVTGWKAVVGSASITGFESLMMLRPN